MGDHIDSVPGTVISLTPRCNVGMLETGCLVARIARDLPIRPRSGAGSEDHRMIYFPLHHRCIVLVARRLANNGPERFVS